MRLNRTYFLCILSVAFAMVNVGCQSGDSGAVDQPFMNNAPPPPKRPDKPSVSVSGVGTTPAPGASAAPP